jgi:hypothetical protein
VAEWSKALVLGTSHFGGVGSNPTAIKFVFPVEKKAKSPPRSENPVPASQDGRVV